MFEILPTEEVQAFNELSQMKQLAAGGLQAFEEYAATAYNRFWKGSVSPMVKVQLLGTTAQEVFTRSAQAQAFLASQIEGYVPLGIPEGFAITWNEDGSAVISEV